MEELRRAPPALEQQHADVEGAEESHHLHHHISFPSKEQEDQQASSFAEASENVGLPDGFTASEEKGEVLAGPWKGEETRRIIQRLRVRADSMKEINGDRTVTPDGRSAKPWHQQNTSRGSLSPPSYCQLVGAYMERCPYGRPPGSGRADTREKQEESEAREERCPDGRPPGSDRALHDKNSEKEERKTSPTKNIPCEQAGEKASHPL